MADELTEKEKAIELLKDLGNNEEAEKKDTVESTPKPVEDNRPINNTEKLKRLNELYDDYLAKEKKLRKLINNKQHQGKEFDKDMEEFILLLRKIAQVQREFRKIEDPVKFEERPNYRKLPYGKCKGCGKENETLFDGLCFECYEE